MRLFKVFLGIVFLLGLLSILMKNTEPVEVDLILKKFIDIPVAVVIIVTVGLGIFIGYIMALSVIMTSKAESRALRSQNKILSNEINSIRNIAVDEGIHEAGDEEEE